MLAKVHSGANLGLDGRLIEVECDLSNGLPAFAVVGLGDKAVDEAKDRVRSALKNTQLVLPPKRVTLNLAPADLPKDGTAYDLPIAVGLLAASGQVEADTISDCMFVGELALDGSLRPIRGAITYTRLALNNKIKKLFLPAQNAAEASLITGVEVFGATSLQQVYRHLVGEELIPPSDKALVKEIADVFSATELANVYGQPMAKRALEIAAAGGHNLLMSGAPGVGKTLLAKALPGILPPPTLEEQIEITQLYSLAGLNAEGVMSSRPFRSPHHTSSDIALIGGGRYPKPGEISLSHRGVLFLDELPEFPRQVLEVLRQPLEDGQVSIARASGSLTFPAKFMLIATQNPCPCGYHGDQLRDCNCTPSQIANYNRKISGPLLDRIDLVVEVARVDKQSLLEAKPAESSQAVRLRVLAAREIQKKRNVQGCTNAEIPSDQINKLCQIDESAKHIAQEALSRLNLSARAYTRTLKVSRTIADLEGSEIIAATHLAEALQYRIRA